MFECVWFTLWNNTLQFDSKRSCFETQISYEFLQKIVSIAQYEPSQEKSWNFIRETTHSTFRKEVLKEAKQTYSEIGFLGLTAYIKPNKPLA